MTSPAQALPLNESRLQRQNQVLVELARRKSLHRGNFAVALQEITKASAHTLEVERTSVWLYSPDRSRISCLDLYERGSDRHSQGQELGASLYPAYFRALELERTIAVHDPAQDSRTAEFGESYLAPLGITAMLDAPIWFAGQMVGVLCHEQVGSLREWSLEEQQFAASISDLLALAMEARDRAIAQAELQASEERLQSFFNATFEAVIIHDQGRILDANHAAEVMLGYSCSELMGMLAPDLAAPESRELIIERLRRLSDQPFEAKGLRKDGSCFDTELSGKSIIYQGQPARVVGIRDISERKQAEADLAALNANLEHQVQERTAQLEQKMLELQELNQLKDVFLHAVSHDLRTPVMGTLLVLNNLIHPHRSLTGPSEEQAAPETVAVPRTVIQRMMDSNHRQLALIDSLLEVHASDVGKLVLHLQPTSVAALVEEIVRDLEPLLSKNQCELQSFIPQDLPLVNLDPTQFRRVYENLITNALKHNPSGLNLDLMARIEGEDLLCIVQDDGIGICQEQAEHLFELYFRGNNARHLTGIGLGLYLCRQIITAHGGRIGVVSEPGRGATFWFTLPLAAATNPCRS
jgi:PAS domain S-box-containing protein